MAEEILDRWETVYNLLFELVADDNSEGRPLRFNLAFEEGVTADLNLRLVDADGEEIKFPVQMVSDTTFRD